MSSKEDKTGIELKQEIDKVTEYLRNSNHSYLITENFFE